MPEQPVVVDTAVELEVDPRELKLRAMLEKPLVDGQNHVGTLIEICQLMGWPSPSFEFEERLPKAGQGPSEGFYCQCSCAGVVGDAIAEKEVEQAEGGDGGAREIIEIGVKPR